jgi:hypothetical protein
MARGPLTLDFRFRGKRYTDADKGLAAFAKVLGTSVERASPALKKELNDYLDTVAAAMGSRHGKRWSASSPSDNSAGGSLNKRSGTLVKSIRDSVRVTGSQVKTIQGQIGSIFYGRTHEFGATITAKRVKYLTIPLPAALDSRGVPRRKSARDWDNTFVITSKKGNLLIVRKRGRGIEPLYVLKRSVRIPKRLGLGDTLEAGLPQFLDKTVSEMTKSILNG